MLLRKKLSAIICSACLPGTGADGTVSKWLLLRAAPLKGNARVARVMTRGTSDIHVPPPRLKPVIQCSVCTALKQHGQFSGIKNRKGLGRDKTERKTSRQRRKVALRRGRKRSLIQPVNLRQFSPPPLRPAPAPRPCTPPLLAPCAVQPEQAAFSAGRCMCPLPIYSHSSRSCWGRQPPP